MLKCDRTQTIKLNLVFRPHCFSGQESNCLFALTALMASLFQTKQSALFGKRKRNAQIRCLIITRQQADTVND